MTVIYSLRSLRDLQDIRDFITEESGDRVVAEQYLNRLLEACDTLATLPERYPAYRYAPGWRMMPHGSHLIFFQSHNDHIRIGHVRHAARKPFKN